MQILITREESSSLLRCQPQARRKAQGRHGALQDQPTLAKNCKAKNVRRLTPQNETSDSLALPAKPFQHVVSVSALTG